MKSVRMYLFNNKVTLKSAATHSPKFFNLLNAEGVAIIKEEWYGRIENGMIVANGLVGSDPVIVRSSTQLICSDKKLAEWAAHGGHLVYYDDRLLRPDGSWGSTKDLLEAAKAFIQKISEIV